MACSNCNTQNCGCSGTYVVSQTCPPACSEVFNSACIVYTGVDITCNDTTVSPAVPTTIVRRNDYLDTALTAIVNYVCSRFNTQIHPTTVVDSGDAYILVSSAIVGAQTTYTITLDPATLPTASIVTGGANAVVTGDGSVGTPYVVNANESIVAVDPASALTLIVDPSTPGPYETTFTIGVDAALLPDTVLQTAFGHILITEIPNTPNAGDTTYTLEVDEVTVETSDDKLDVTLTSAGGVAPFERTFDVTVDDAQMASFVMDTLNQTGGAGSIGLQEGPGIQLQYQAGTSTMIISSTFLDPVKWLTVEDFEGESLDAASTTSTIVLSADASSGLTAVLGGDGNTATFTLENVDKGSDQLTFVDVTCSNVSGTVGGTASALVNGDVLTLVGGTDIDLTVLSNQITIDNLIDRVYSEIQSDAGDTLQAPNTTSTFTIAGGTGIGTTGDLASQTITINNEALVYDTITGDTGSTTASGLDDSLAIVSSGAGCSTTVTSDTITIENTGVTSAIAGAGISVDVLTGAVTITAQVERDDFTESGTAVAATVTEDMNHTVTNLAGVLETYVQVRIFALSTNSGFFPGDDITSADCRINMVAGGDYQVTTTSYTGNILAVVLG
jgi:hypothetical protein